MHFKAVIQNSIDVNFLPFYFSCKIITTSISKLKLSGVFKKQKHERDIGSGKGRKILGKGNLRLREKLGFRS